MEKKYGGICEICQKEMKAEEWTWADGDAHKECVLTEADSICSDDCGFFDILGNSDGFCRECGKAMRPITKEDRERWRKQG